MGACYISFNLPGTLSAYEIQNKFKERQDRDRGEHGSDGYNGTFSTCSWSGVLSRDVFPTVEAADTYLDEQLSKRYVGAVKARDVRKVTLKKPTFGGVERSYQSQNEGVAYAIMPPKDAAGKELWLVPRIMVPADQLGEREKAKLLKLYDQFKATAQPALVAKNVFVPLTEALGKVKEEFTAWKELKAARATYGKLLVKHEKAAAELSEFDGSLKEKLWADGTEDKGEVWVIGGVASM